MYHIAAYFDIPPEHHNIFIAAALQDAYDSERNESGTKGIVLIRDESRPNRFYLDEVYDDRVAFDCHCTGPHYKRFFEAIAEFATEPDPIIRGTRIEDHKR